jgi:uncharacterized protein with gpF-like domain
MSTLILTSPKRIEVVPFNLETEEQKSAYWKDIDRRRGAFIRWGEIETMKMFRKQLRRVSEAVRNVSTPSEAETVASRAVDRTVSVVREDIELIYSRVGYAFARDVHNSLKSHLGMEIKRDELQGEWVRRLRRFIESEGTFELIAGLSGYTKRVLRSVIRRGVEDGLGIDKIARMITNDPALQIVTRSRAKRIARTEIISASNFGSQMGAGSTGLVLNKEYIATRDERTRGPADDFDHYSMDGQIRAMDEPYTEPNTGEELQYPGDVNASPGNRVNCRCTESYQEQ